MNFTLERVKKQGLKLAIFSSVLTLAFFRLLGWICQELGLYKASDNGLVSITDIFIRIIMIVLLLVIAEIFGIRKDIYFKTKFIWNVLPMCWLSFVYSLFILLIMLSEYIKKDTPIILTNSVILVFSMFAVGIFEELTTRELRLHYSKDILVTTAII